MLRRSRPRRAELSVGARWVVADAGRGGLNWGRVLLARLNVGVGVFGGVGQC